jgi:hypothetical protein
MNHVDLTKTKYEDGIKRIALNDILYFNILI